MSAPRPSVAALRAAREREAFLEAKANPRRGRERAGRALSRVGAYASLAQTAGGAEGEAWSRIASAFAGQGIACLSGAAESGAEVIDLATAVAGRAGRLSASERQ